MKIKEQTRKQAVGCSKQPLWGCR